MKKLLLFLFIVISIGANAQSLRLNNSSTGANIINSFNTNFNTVVANQAATVDSFAAHRSAINANTAVMLRWDGGATGLNAATGRNSLGATTIGSSIFTMGNPGEKKYLQLNANNTASSLTAAEFRAAIGAGSGSSGTTVGIDDYVVEQKGDTIYATPNPSTAYPVHKGINVSVVLNNTLAELTTGGSVLIKGKYVNVSPITIAHDNTRIRGEGMYKTSFKLKALADTEAGGGDLIYFNGRDYCTFSDIELDGNMMAQQYRDDGLGGITARSEGIMMYDTTAYDWTNYNVIERCYVHDFAALGIRIFRGVGNIVRDSRVINNGWGDINFSGFTSNSFMINNVAGGSGNGALETMGDNNIISGNIVLPMSGNLGTSNGKIGIENEFNPTMGRLGDGNQITNNVIIGGGETKLGILSTTSNSIISGNIISDLTPTGVYNSTGIWIKGDSGSVVQGNYIYGDTHYGIIVDNSINEIITNNVVKDARAKGMLIRFNSKDNYISNNYLQTASWQSLFELYDGSNDNVIKDNVFNGLQTDKALVYADAGTNNLFYNNFVSSINTFLPEVIGGGGGGLTQPQVSGIVHDTIVARIGAGVDISTFLNAKENSLGNPSTNGYVLSSTTGGVRSWVEQGGTGGGLTSGQVAIQINDSLQAIRTGAIQGVAVVDSNQYKVGGFATPSFVNNQIAAAGGGGTPDSLVLNDGALFLTGDDRLTFQTNGDASYSLPTGGGNLILQSRVEDMMRDSIASLRSQINYLISIMEDYGFGDITRPTLSSVEFGTFADDTLIAIFSENLQQDSIPIASAFTLTEDGNDFGIASVDINHDTVFIVGDSIGQYGSAYLLSYAPNYPELQDSSGNKVANFTGMAITNNFAAPPLTMTKAELGTYNDTIIAVIFSASLASTLPNVDSFKLMAGTSRIGLNALTRNADTLFVALDSMLTVYDDSTLLLSYVKPGTGNVLASTTGAEIASFADSSVTNNLKEVAVNMLANGTLSSTDYWDAETGFTVADGVATYDNVATSGLRQLKADMVSELKANTTYELAFDIVISTGLARFFVTDYDDDVIFVYWYDWDGQGTGRGSVEFTTVSNPGTGFRIAGSTISGAAWTIDNISLTEVK